MKEHIVQWIFDQYIQFFHPANLILIEERIDILSILHVAYSVRNYKILLLNAAYTVAQLKRKKII